MRLTINDKIEGLQHHQLGMVIHICNPNTQRLRKEDHNEFGASMGHTVCLRTTGLQKQFHISETKPKQKYPQYTIIRAI